MSQNTQVGYHEFLFKQGRETWSHSSIKSRATNDYIGEGGALGKKRYLATLTETTLHRVVL